jgi:hypothetical protein
MLGQSKPKTRKCKVKSCGTRFTAYSSFVTWCSPECGSIIGLSKLEEQQAKKRREERAADRKRKEEMMSRPEWVEAAQKAFNAYIRARDADKPCICCGKPFEPQKFGGSMDAGHYLSRGAAPHLRFDERNCHGQRKNCNRPGGTTREAFRAGMIARIGLEAVEALEADQTPRKYSIAELKEIKATYKRKLKELKGAA